MFFVRKFVMALFPFSIGLAICGVLTISYSYPHDDTDSLIFVLMAVLTMVISAVSGRSI